MDPAVILRRLLAGTSDGPWFLGGSGVDESDEGDGRWYVWSGHPDGEDFLGSPPEAIAMIDPHDHRDHEVCEAHAQLVAAAPALAQALLDALDVHREQVMPDDWPYGKTSLCHHDRCAWPCPTVRKITDALERAGVRDG